MSEIDPEAQLAAFIAKFAPEIADHAHTILEKMRARLPGAIEIVYDNYNALAIGFGPSERMSEVIFSIALFQGIGLPDPHKLLAGSGKVARHIVLTEPAMLDNPAVCALMTHALKRAVKPLDPSEPHRIVIKSISAKQRPRRPASK
jgi:hypothetical protein